MTKLNKYQLEAKRLIEEDGIVHINGGTFAEACYDGNSLDELYEQLEMNKTDSRELKEWNLTTEEWCNEIELAIIAKESDLI